MKPEHADEMHAPDAEADGKRPGSQPKRSHPVVPKPPESAREIESGERRHRAHDARQQEQPIAVRSSHGFLYTTKRRQRRALRKATRRSEPAHLRWNDRRPSVKDVWRASVLRNYSMRW